MNGANKDGELSAVETYTLEEGEEDEEVRLMFVKTGIMQYTGCPNKSFPLSNANNSRNIWPKNSI